MLAHIVALSPREETNFKYRIFFDGRNCRCRFVNLSKAGARESPGRGLDGARTETRDSRGMAGMQDGTDFRFLLPSCRGGGGLVRTTCGGASAGRRNEGQKVSRILYGRRLQPDGKCGPKPRFQAFSSLLKISLRQEISVFAARRKFLSAKNLHFCRTKVVFRPGKCATGAFPGPSF